MTRLTTFILMIMFSISVHAQKTEQVTLTNPIEAGTYVSSVVAIFMLDTNFTVTDSSIILANRIIFVSKIGDDLFIEIDDVYDNSVKKFKITEQILYENIPDSEAGLFYSEGPSNPRILWVNDVKWNRLVISVINSTYCISFYVSHLRYF